jgi:hypothetical protein
VHLGAHVPRADRRGNPVYYPGYLQLARTFLVAMQKIGGATFLYSKNLRFFEYKKVIS